jgi:hypothetical protein
MFRVYDGKTPQCNLLPMWKHDDAAGHTFRKKELQPLSEKSRPFAGANDENLTL